MSRACMVTQAEILGFPRAPVDLSRSFDAKSGRIEVSWSCRLPCLNDQVTATVAVVPVDRTNCMTGLPWGATLTVTAPDGGSCSRRMVLWAGLSELEDRIRALLPAALEEVCPRTATRPMRHLAVRTTVQGFLTHAQPSITRLLARGPLEGSSAPLVPSDV
jgi:hypothetical protein